MIGAEYGLILSGEMPPPEVVEAFAEVSLVRGEYVLRRSGSYVTTAAGRAALRGYLEEICRAFHPKPVWYRLSDFESREISTLDGADAHLDEENPILGPRGTRRALLFPRSLVHEVGCVAEVMAGWPNLRYLPSYVGTVDELGGLLDLIEENNLPAPAGCMIEVPSAVRQINLFPALGVQRFLVGLNDLTSLLFGAHRGLPHHERDHVMIEEIVAAVAATGVDTVVANSVSSAHAERLRTAGARLAAVHYHDLPAWFGESCPDLPDLHLVAEIKRTTAGLLALRKEGKLSA